MPYTAVTFRKRAAECLELAGAAESESMRLKWQRIGTHYERLADIAERLETDETVAYRPLFT